MGPFTLLSERGSRTTDKSINFPPLRRKGRRQGAVGIVPVINPCRTPRAPCPASFATKQGVLRPALAAAKGLAQEKFK